jgi:protein SCO1/2
VTNKRKAAAILVFTAAAAAAAAAVSVSLLRDHPGASHQGKSYGAAAIGGPFHLVDQDGKAVDQSVLKGKWSAVFFGYTFCPDFCPTNLQTLARAQDQLGARGKDFQVVFISIDPERDTPQLLKTYLGNQGFPKGAVGLTGTPAQVAEAAKVYRAYYHKAGQGPDYLMDHSSVTYLMDPQGRFVEPIREGVTPDEVAKQISKAMAGG